MAGGGEQPDGAVVDGHCVRRHVLEHLVGLRAAFLARVRVQQRICEGENNTRQRSVLGGRFFSFARSKFAIGGNASKTAANAESAFAKIATHPGWRANALNWLKRVLQ